MPDLHRKLDVFVHLARGFDAGSWEKRWSRGELIGFNERLPYGYHLAREMGCSVRFSRDRHENYAQRIIRILCRVVLGFDFLQAWYNRREILAASVVWTHTESQHLSIALLMKLLRPSARPKIVGQSVWLIDRWHGFSWLHKKLYRWLAAEIDVLTFHSPLNLSRARDIFGYSRCELVRFGICCDRLIPPKPPAHDGRIRVLAVGNDRHRDWDCLLTALADQAGIELHIVSQTLARRRLGKASNCRLHSLRHQDELVALYKAADVVVVPLRPNFHASGISALQEAALAGRPAVCTRVGGLSAYFSENEVTFVEPGRPDELRTCVIAAGSNNSAMAMARRAQRRMTRDDLSSWSFIRRHVEISRRLVASECNEKLTYIAAAAE